MDGCRRYCTGVQGIGPLARDQTGLKEESRSIPEPRNTVTIEKVRVPRAIWGSKKPPLPGALLRNRDGLTPGHLVQQNVGILVDET